MLLVTFDSDFEMQRFHLDFYPNVILNYFVHVTKDIRETIRMFKERALAYKQNQQINGGNTLLNDIHDPQLLIYLFEISMNSNIVKLLQIHYRNYLSDISEESTFTMVQILYSHLLYLFPEVTYKISNNNKQNSRQSCKQYEKKINRHKFYIYQSFTKLERYYSIYGLTDAIRMEALQWSSYENSKVNMLQTSIVFDKLMNDCNQYGILAGIKNRKHRKYVIQCACSVIQELYVLDTNIHNTKKWCQLAEIVHYDATKLNDITNYYYSIYGFVLQL
jgi:hypothetical protein